MENAEAQIIRTQSSLNCLDSVSESKLKEEPKKHEVKHDNQLNTNTNTNTLESKMNKEDKDDNTPIEFSLEDIFINLTLISRIEVGNKLVKNGKYVNIDTSYFQFITRWFNSQNRSDSIRFTASILSRSFEFSDSLAKHKDDESRQNLLRLNTSLSNAIGGLSNLSQTYHYDKLTQSEIEVMINNIRTKLNIQSKHIHFVDDTPPIKNKNTSELSSNMNDKHDKHDKEKKDITDLKHSIVENFKREKRDDKRDDKRDEKREYRDHNRDYREDEHPQGHLKKKSL
jgi:hypothetical protein